jgi:hypothetical protein
MSQLTVGSALALHSVLPSDSITSVSRDVTAEVGRVLMMSRSCIDPGTCNVCADSRREGFVRLRTVKSVMISATASIAIGAALLLGQARAACTYGKLPSQVMLANDALRVPIAGADPDAECAATAAAFGYKYASTSAPHF